MDHREDESEAAVRLVLSGKDNYEFFFEMRYRCTRVFEQTIIGVYTGRIIPYSGAVLGVCCELRPNRGSRSWQQKRECLGVVRGDGMASIQAGDASPKLPTT